MVLRIRILLSLLVCFWYDSTNAYRISHAEELSELASDEMPKYLIFDTDMGPDDAWALQMVLNAEKQLKNVKLLAITVTYGNTDVVNVIRNTYRILDGLNRTDVPIYKGASEAIIPINLKMNYFYGKNGFSDVEFWKPHYPSDIDSIIQPKNAVEIIRDLAMKHPNNISLLCLAPMTNIALAIKTYPEIKDNIEEIFIMGGSITGKGNIIPTAEFNFYKDPESVYIILNSLISPITILPLDVDDNLHISLEWRLNTVGKINQTNVQLLNEVEKIAYRNVNETVYLPSDTFTSAAFLFPKKIIKVMNPYNVTMELQGFHTRGEMIVNHLSTDYNVRVIEKIDEREFKKIMLWTANYV